MVEEMESLPAYLFWSAVGVVALVSFFLGGLMMGLALVGRWSRKGQEQKPTFAPVYRPAENSFGVDPQEPLPFFLNPDQLHRSVSSPSFPAPLA